MIEHLSFTRPDIGRTRAIKLRKVELRTADSIITIMGRWIDDDAVG